MFIVLRERNLEISKKTRDMKNPVKPMNNPKTHYPNTHPENKSGFLPALKAIIMVSACPHVSCYFSDSSTNNIESSYATFTTIKDSFLSIDLWKHSEILRGSAHESHSWQIASPIWRAAIPLILLLDGSLLIGALQQLHQFFYNRVIFFLCGSK